jgi:uncharacterized Tic20 family protein
MSTWWERRRLHQEPRPRGRRLAAGSQLLVVMAHLAPLPIAGLVLLAVGRPVVWTALAVPLGPAAVRWSAGLRDALVRSHATEALNFNLSIALYAGAIGGLLSVVGLTPYTAILAPLLLLLLLLVFANWLVLMGLAAVEAGRGARFGYPWILRLVPGGIG